MICQGFRLFYSGGFEGGSIIIAYFLFRKDTPTLGSAQLSSISYLLSHVQ